MRGRSTAGLGALDQLADYLKRAGILHSGTFPIQGASRNYLLILEGGVGVLAKPEDENDPQFVHREVAAWEVSRLLGWEDMVSATVLRTIPSFLGTTQVTASVQVLWPDNQPDVDPGFSDRDIWRAAAFDAVVLQTDRDGHNWLAVLARDQNPSLKLVDHAYAFGLGVSEPSSTFFTARHGQPLPVSVSADLRTLVQGLAGSPISNLLGQAATDAIRDRTQALLGSGQLQLP
jgi:hypothetical protein